MAYRCDGCGVEAFSTHGWSSLIPLLTGQSAVTVLVNSDLQHPDYCERCCNKIRDAVKSHQ
jgi:hypothetical protein